MEEKKPKFVPNIPQSRPVREEAAPVKQRERPQRKRAPKKTIDPAEAVASGPFALGPAKRTATKIVRSGGSSSSGAVVKVKAEPGQDHLHVGSDVESVESDVDFDLSDPNAPCSILKQSISHQDQMKVETKDDNTNDLILIQVPSIIPSIISSSVASVSSVSPMDLDNVAVKQENVHSNPNAKKGRIGSLVVHPDGRMELKISNLAFDMSNAPNSHLLQKLVSIDGKKAIDLGKVSQRMICTPQID